MRKPKCRMCRHYHSSPELPLFGRCHANPPPHKYQIDINILGRTWISIDLIPQTDDPIVHTDHSCGRFSPK